MPPGARSLYQILDVAPTASLDEIKSAYRKLARQLHPDRTNGDPKKTERFKLVNDAYAILGDKKKRDEYDSGKAPDLIDMVLGSEAGDLIARIKNEGITSDNLDSLIENFFSVAGEAHKQMPDRLKDVQPKDILRGWESLFRGDK